MMIENFSYGGAFVECSLPHPTEVEIVQLVFRVNEVRRRKTRERNKKSLIDILI